MMTDLKNNKSTYQQFKKYFQKRVHIFSTQLLFSNKVPPLLYLLINLTNFGILFVILIEPFLQFLWYDTLNIVNLNKFNFVILIGKEAYFIYISIALSCFLFTSGLILITCFALSIKIKNYEDVLAKGSASLCSLLIVVNGRSIFPILLSIQFLSIRCYWQPEICYPSFNGYFTLFFNIVGLCFSLIFLQLQSTLNMCFFPDLEIPWASPPNKYEMINKFLLIAVPFLYSFQDFLATKISPIFIIIGLFLLLILHVLSALTNIYSYNKIINYSIIIKSTILLVLALHSIAIFIINKVSNPIICISIFVNVAVFSTLMVFLKKIILLAKLKQNSEGQNADALQGRITGFFIMSLSNSIDENLFIQQFYLKHINNCADEQCPCIELNNSTKSKLNHSHSSFRVQQSLKVAIKDETESLRSNQGFHLKRMRNQNDRNDTILKILISQSKNKSPSQFVNFFEVYISIKTYHRLYQSFYNLIKTKKQFRNSLDYHSYYSIKIMALQELKSFAKTLNVKVLNVYDMLLIEKKFDEYQAQILHTSIMVEKFWVHILKENYNIKMLLNIGISLVESYMKVREQYTILINLKPEFKELVQINISFYQEVMNFELESEQSAHLLRAIISKHKMVEQNYYASKNEDGIQVVSFNPKTYGIITYCNQTACSLLGYQMSKLKGKNHNILIPKLYQNDHSIVVENYLNRNIKRYQQQQMERIWAINKWGYIIPLKIQVQTFISQRIGLALLVNIKQCEEYKKKFDFIKNESQLYILLADEFGKIQYTSKNIYPTRYSDADFLEFLANELIVTVDNLFPDLGMFTQQELKDGVITQMVKNSADFNSTIKSIQKVKLLMKRVKINDLTITEIIFQPSKNKDSLKNFNKHNSKKSFLSTLRLQNINQQIQEQNESNESSQKQFQQILLEDSVTSSISNTHEMLLLQKGSIDFNETPKEIMNMKRAIIFYFLIMIATSFSILIMSAISYKRFISDNETFQQSLLILLKQQVNGLNRFRMQFRMLLQTTNPNYNPSDTLENDFQYIQSQQSADYLIIKGALNYIQSNINSMSDSMLHLARDNLVLIQEIDSNGNYYKSNQAFLTSIIQYFARSQKYLGLSFNDVKNDFQSFSIINMPNNPTIYQQDAYYFIINGQNDLRLLARQVEDQYVADSIKKESQYSTLMMIICLCCILISLISTIFMVPNVVSLDKEQEKIVQKWFLLSKEIKQNMIQVNNQLKINSFTMNLSNEQSEEDQLSERQKYQQLDEIKIIEEGKHDNQSLKTLKTLKTEKFEKSIVSNLSSDKFKSSSQTINNILNPQKIKMPKQSLISFGPPIKTNDQSQNKDNDKKQELEENQEQQEQQLKSIFLYKKFVKLSILITYSLLIMGIYFSSYIESKTIYDQAASCFNYQSIVDERRPCVLNALLSVIEQAAQNTTLMFKNQSAFDFLENRCFDIEKQIQEIYNFPPKQLKQISQTLIDINSDKLCSIIFNTTTDIQKCQNYNNGILKEGLYSAIQSLYYTCQRELLQFQSTLPQLKTQQFLTEIQFNNEIQNLGFFNCIYLKQINNYVKNIISQASQANTASNIQYFVLGFCFFILILIASMILAIKIILKILKNVVFRSKILIKLVPVEELKRIYEIQQRKK